MHIAYNTEQIWMFMEILIGIDISTDELFVFFTYSDTIAP